MPVADAGCFVYCVLCTVCLWRSVVLQLASMRHAGLRELRTRKMLHTSTSISAHRGGVGFPGPFWAQNGVKGPSEKLQAPGRDLQGTTDECAIGPSLSLFSIFDCCGFWCTIPGSLLTCLLPSSRTVPTMGLNRRRAPLKI